MAYRLKRNIESFEMVDGPFAGRKFVSGETYGEVPPGLGEKFDRFPEEATQAKAPPTRRSEKPEVTDA